MKHRPRHLAPAILLLVMGHGMAACADASGSQAGSAATPVPSDGSGTTTRTVGSTTSAVVTMPPAPTTSTTTTTTAATTTSTTIADGTMTDTGREPAVREVTSDDPLRLWVIGDSLAGPLGWGIEEIGRRIGVVTTTMDYRGGSGLVTPEFFDWPATVERRLPEVRPEAIVVSIGANDGAPIRTGAGWVEPDTAEWFDAYRMMVGEFMDQLAQGSERVYWVGLPVMRAESYTARTEAFNALSRELIASRPAVTYVSSLEVLSDAGGAYADALPDAHGVMETVREPDGIHYTQAGANRLARAVMDVVAAEWGLPGPR